MRQLLYFVLPLLIINAYAVESYRLKSGGLRLIGKSCQELREQEKALCDWKKELGESGQVGAKCVRLRSGKYRLDTNSCVPEDIKKVHNLRVNKDGPNCWGTALSLKGYTSSPKFVWPEEIRYWLNSPACRKLSPGEALRPGDLISSFGPEYLHEGRDILDAGGHFWDALYPGRRVPVGASTGYSGYHWNLHTETYISEALSYGKDSPSKLDKLRFHPFSEMYGRPRSNNSECQELQSKKPHYREALNAPGKVRRSKCGYFSLAYRCGNLKDLTKGLAPESSFHRETKELEIINDKLFKTIFGTSPVDQRLAFVAKIRAEQAAQTAYDTLVEIGKGELQNKDLEMLATKQYFFAKGILKFLDFQEK